MRPLRNVEEPSPGSNANGKTGARNGHGLDVQDHHTQLADMNVNFHGRKNTQSIFFPSR
jgi:hypothetical protein